MNRTFYVHRPCLAVAVAFGCGICLGTRIDWAWWIWTALSVMFGAAAFLMRHQARSVWAVHVLFVVLGMMCVTNVRLLPPDHVAHLSYEQRRDVNGIEGVIVSDPFVRTTARGEKASFDLSVERIELNDAWLDRRGKVLVNVFRHVDLEYGDRIRLTGKLHKPFNEGFAGRFSYEDYLKRNGIYWILSVKKASAVDVLAQDKGAFVGSALLKMRRRLQAVLDQHLTAFESGVIQSLVLGGRYYIPERTRELFVQTGTAHILAISGMNVGGMAFLIFLILNVLRLPRRAQIVLTCLLLIVYCFLTGANPSVVRATVMAVIMLAGLLFERQSDTLNSLGLSAVIILLTDPMSLFDIGFQLSFTGVFAIIYLYPVIYRLFEGRIRNRIAVIALQALCISLAAWIGVLPLIAYYFQIVTPVSILANIPIIPFVSVLFMLGFGLIVAGLFCPASAFLFAGCIKIVLFLLMTIVDSFSRIPFGYFYLFEVHPYLVVGYYLIVCVVFSRLPLFSRQHQPGRNLHFLG